MFCFYVCGLKEINIMQQLLCFVNRPATISLKVDEEG